MAELPILIAHDSADLAGEIQEALSGLVSRLEVVRTGEEALSRILREHPRVLVVDVAIPGKAPFELCDVIHQAGLRTRVVLVASVYNRTRYKRRPTSLYGADDYVEQHHIHDMLPVKVRALLEGGAGRTDVPHTFVDDRAVRRVRQASDALLTIQFDDAAEGRARAGRLAELIVADVALYNLEALEAMHREREAPDRLAEDLEEAREIFARLVPPEIRGERDWIGDQFDRLLARRPVERAVGTAER